MNQSYTLHVIALDVPWPANYGGVIDIYHKVRMLHAYGIRVILHCWQYGDDNASELEAICSEVHYYQRQVGMRANLSLRPYNVKGRSSRLLVERLLQDDYPILYEGLHCTAPMLDARLAHRRHIVRMCNVEHDYYWAISRSARSCLSKLFHAIEAVRFRHYEPILKHADLVLAVSSSDVDSLRSRYPSTRIELLPCFHQYDQVQSLIGQGDYILYHAKLSVPENTEAALYLVEHVLAYLPYRAVIAGMNPPSYLVDTIARYKHIELVANPSFEAMEYLIQNAHIQLLYTNQSTGLKLKLLSSLFGGRHVVANSTMLCGSGLQELCHLGGTPKELRYLCDYLMSQPFLDRDVAKRKNILASLDTEMLGYKALKLIFELTF